MTRSRAIRVALFVLALLLIGGGYVLVHHSRGYGPTSTIPGGVSDFRTVTTHDIRTLGPEKAYAAFKDRYAKKEFSIQHNAAHLFGATLYDVKGISGIGTCDTDLNYGCFHGFLTQAIAAQGLKSVGQLTDACNATVRPITCQHGIGHGIVEYLGHDHLSDALDACDLTHPTDPIAGCRTGVLMEFYMPISFAADGTASLSVRPMQDPANPYDLCPTLSARFQAACYYWLPQWWESLYGKDFARMGRMCLAAPAQEYQRDCVDGIGNIVPSSSAFDTKKSIAYCTEMPDAASRSRCFSTAASSYSANINDGTAQRALCALAQKEDRAYCKP